MLREAEPPAPEPPSPVKGRRALPPPPPPPDLIRLLSDGEARVRRRAALAVGRVGLTEAAPGLLSLLHGDPDPEVRQMAAFALGLIGDASPATLQALQQSLSDASPLVSGRAAEALGLIGDAASAPAIAKLAAANLAAASAVAPDESGYPLDPGVEAFRLAVYALARLKAYDPLAGAVLDGGGQPRVRWWPVAYALQRVEDKRAAPALLAVLKSGGVYARGFAARGLGTLKERAAVPALIALAVPAREVSGPAVEAIRALGQIGDPAATEALLKVIRDTEVHPMLRAEAIEAAAAVGADTTADLFLDALADPSPAVRSAALIALAGADDDRFMAVLSGLDPDPHWSVRAQLATVLGMKPADRVLPRLTRMLEDSDERVIPAVLTALTRLKSPDAGKILLEHLGHDDAVVRTAAAANLGELKPPGSAEALAAAYKRGEADSTYTARAAALTALAKLGAQPALPTLRAALADKNWAVRVKAAELVRSLDPALDAFQMIRPAPIGRSVAYDAPSLVSPAVSPHVFVETDKGMIEIELDVLNAPLNADSFAALAAKGFFQGVPFHRLVPDFVVQGGDPRGDGEGGPGYTLRDELSEEPYLRGTVGMALDWRDTGGSQFFIAYGPQPQLDARYTVLGRVVSGMDVADKLTQWDVMRRVRVWTGE